MKQPGSPGEGPSIFISYNRADLAEAAAVDAGLKADGLRTFIDKERVDGTADFQFTIYDAIHFEVTHIVVVLTDNAAHSRWVRFEVLVAERSGKQVIIYRRPEWALPASWESWLPSQVCNLEDLVARIRRKTEPPVAKSIRWNLTTYPTPEFVNRISEVEEIATRLAQSAAPLVLTGLGGMGKTQLALEHIFRRHADYDLIWWVRASERTMLLTDLAAFGLELKIPGADPERLQETAEAVVEWLSQRKDYLLVFDSASQPELMVPFVPPGGGHCLLTSRRTDWPWGPPLNVTQFDTDSSVGFLMRRTQLPRSVAMENVARHLDGLPLALAQAGAYVIQKHISFSEYSDRLVESKSRLMEAGALIESDARVASTWDLSFTAALAETPEALSVIAMAAFLAPDGIPRKLVAPEGRDEYLEDPEQSDSESGETDAALHALSRYSLISLMPRSFSIHGLVQDIFRDRLGDGGRWLQSALERLDENLPHVIGGHLAKRFAKGFDELSPHVLAATKHSALRGENVRLCISLLLDIGGDMTRRSLLSDARESLELALRMGEEKFGEYSPVLTEVLNSLGLTYDYVGDFAAAECAYKRGLGIAGQTANQSELAVQLHRNLAALYHNMNEQESAQEVIEPLLIQPAPGSMESIASLQKLGQVHMAQGQLELAEGEFIEILKLRETGHPQDDEELGQSYADLGQLYSRKKDWEKALDFFARAIEIYRREVGEDHLFLGITLHNRSSVYEGMERLSEALNDLESARSIVTKAAGGTHPYLAAILFAMARLFIRLGKPRNESDELLLSTIKVCQAHPEMSHLSLIKRQASMLLEMGPDQTR